MIIIIELKPPNLLVNIYFDSKIFQTLLNLTFFSEHVDINLIKLIK